MNRRNFLGWGLTAPAGLSAVKSVLTKHVGPEAQKARKKEVYGQDTHWIRAKINDYYVYAELDTVYDGFQVTIRAFDNWLVRGDMDMDPGQRLEIHYLDLVRNTRVKTIPRYSKRIWLYKGDEKVNFKLYDCRKEEILLDHDMRVVGYQEGKDQGQTTGALILEL